MKLSPSAALPRPRECPGPGITHLRGAAAGRPGTLPSAERATTDSLRQQLSTYRDEISRLRTENQELRDQLARHLGAARAAAATAET